MLNLTVSVPNVAQVLAAGYNGAQLQKSQTQSAAGPYANVAGASVTLSAGVTSYGFTDVAGAPGDWYVVVYTQSGLNPSAPGPAMPGYLSDLLANVRDLLGVTINEAPDSLIQGFGFLPSGLARCRSRLPTFDTVVAAGGDLAAFALSALAHYTAALLCPRMTVQVVDSEQFDRYRYQRNRQMDWSATAETLMAEYHTLISLAAGESATSAVFDNVGPVLLAGPSSGGQDTSGGLVPMYPAVGYGTPARFDKYGNPIGQPIGDD